MNQCNFENYFSGKKIYILKNSLLYKICSYYANKILGATNISHLEWYGNYRVMTLSSNKFPFFLAHWELRGQKLTKTLFGTWLCNTFFNYFCSGPYIKTNSVNIFRLTDKSTTQYGSREKQNVLSKEFKKNWRGLDLREKVCDYVTFPFTIIIYIS